MRGTSNSYVVSIHSSLLLVFQYHASNPPGRILPLSEAEAMSPRRGRHLGFKAGSPELQGHPREN
jgi:hypothetical protein